MNFISQIGAVEPSIDDQNYQAFRRIFKNQNYFFYDGTFLLVKISRNDRQFWGISKRILDFLERSRLHYFLVLLDSASSGWVFSHIMAKSEITNSHWSLAQDRQYKVGRTYLQHETRFIAIEQFIQKIKRMRE